MLFSGSGDRLEELCVKISSGARGEVGKQKIEECERTIAEVSRKRGNCVANHDTS